MQIRIAKEIIERFYCKKRFKLYFVILLSLISSIFEYLGLILIFQFILILSNPNNSISIAIINFFKINTNIHNNATINLILGISIALIYIFKNIYMYFFTKINSNVMQDLSISMALKIIKKILYSAYEKINSIPNSHKQSIMAKIDIVIWYYFIQYINLITNLAIILILLLFLTIKFPMPAIISFLFISVLSFIEFKILKTKSDYQNKYYSLHFDNLTVVLHKIINATKEIKISNKSGYFLSEAVEKYKNLANMNKKKCSNSVFHIYFTEISIMLTFIIVITALYLTDNFNNQAIIVTLGTIIAVILRITPATNRAQSAIYSINSHEKIVKQIIDFDKQFEDIIDTYETDESLPFEKEIKLKNISYKYPNNTDGLSGINLTINYGDFIGIVGASGCYKTTLSLIISGLIKPQSGEIYVDNTLINNHNYKKWQNNISILSQDFSILKDNIFDGLDKETIKKLELSNLNSNPLFLSFGQKQRASLAQKLIQNKKLLILDEATSSLDVISEEKINSILLEEKGKRTIISIAHRLQILKYCDKIIYMDNGKIIDIDTFYNLNNKYSEFAKIIELSNFKLGH